MVFPFINCTGNMTDEPDGQLPPGRGSQTLFANHCTPIPLDAGAAVGEIAIGPLMSGRSVARPVNEFAFAAGIQPGNAPTLPASSVTGFPPCDCSINESCHPSLNWLPLNGSSYNPLITNR